MNAICRTDGCVNEGFAIAVPNTRADLLGNIVPIDAVMCGPCSEFTDLEPEPDPHD